MAEKMIVKRLIHVHLLENQKKTCQMAATAHKEKEMKNMLQSTRQKFISYRFYFDPHYVI